MNEKAEAPGSAPPVRSRARSEWIGAVILGAVTVLIGELLADPIGRPMGRCNPFLGCLGALVVAAIPVGVGVGIATRGWRPGLALTAGTILGGALVGLTASITSGFTSPVSVAAYGAVLVGSIWAIVAVPSYVVGKVVILGLRFACDRR
jgi:hypothetical protein